MIMGKHQVAIIRQIIRKLSFAETILTGVGYIRFPEILTFAT